MHRVFNCGIGMVIVVAAADAAKAMDVLKQAGENVYQIGVVRPRVEGEAHTIVKP